MFQAIMIISGVSDMAMVDSLQKAIEYMEEQLLEPITIGDIAKQAHMSPYHFQRTFTILTDVSVGEYIRRRRLTRAAEELLNTDAKIIDLALKYGYDTPESFTKAFRKQHGMSPSDVRKGNGSLQAYNRLVIQVHLKGAEPMQYQVVEREAFQVVGLKQTFQCDGEHGPSQDINQLWAKYGQDGTIGRIAQWNNGPIQGMLGLTVDFSQERNELEYWVATEHTGPVPDGLSGFEVPASKWIVFAVTGPVAQAMPETWRKIYSEWFPSHAYEHSGAPSIEVYKSADPTSPTAQSEIWVPVKS